MESAKNPAQPSVPGEARPKPPSPATPALTPAGTPASPHGPGHAPSNRAQDLASWRVPVPARPADWPGAAVASRPDLPRGTAVTPIAARGDDVQQDLPISALWIGLGVVVFLALVFGSFVPLPKLFVRSGEDRSLLEPADPRVYAIFLKAKGGDADAMITLASLYLQGQGVFRDDVMAVKWLKAAAKLDNIGALYNMGILYMNGRGVPRDETHGFQLFESTANRGYAPSMIQLGYCYAMGRGVASDRTQAATWLRRAATSSDNSIRLTALELLRQLGA